jgi:hypothetical protein
MRSTQNISLLIPLSRHLQNKFQSLTSIHIIPLWLEKYNLWVDTDERGIFLHIKNRNLLYNSFSPLLLYD